MPVKNISGIGRPLKVEYPTNRAIIYIVLSSFILGTLIKFFTNEAFLSSTVWALRFSVTLLLTWALARELDPDNNASAFISVVLGLATFVLFPPTSLLVLFWLVLVSRILNRITGISPQLLDVVGIVSLAIFMSWRESWIFGVLTALVLFTNSWLDNEKKRGTLLLIIVIVPVLVLLFNFKNDFLMNADPSTEIIIFLTACTVLFVPVIYKTNSLKTFTDMTSEPISVIRLRVTRIMALTTGALVFIIQGSAGFNQLLPLWMVLVSISFMYYRSLINRLIKAG
jgi:hypothetical protein